MFSIDLEKLKKITCIVNNNSDPRATEEEVFALCAYACEDGERGQGWFDFSRADEIARWISTKYE